jgi:hypothetical protein
MHDRCDKNHVDSWRVASIITLGGFAMPKATDGSGSAVVKAGGKPGKKYFTVGEANRSLTYVSRVTSDLIDCYGKMISLQHLIHHPKGQAVELLEDQFDRLKDHMEELVAELKFAGVEVKDVERGLLDFLALHEGREIYLCWHFGEKAVTSWHELDSGFSGRQDVSLLTATKP